MGPSNTCWNCGTIDDPFTSLGGDTGIFSLMPGRRLSGSHLANVANAFIGD